MKRRHLTSALVLAALIAAGCSSDDTSSAGDATAADAPTGAVPADDDGGSDGGSSTAPGAIRVVPASDAATIHAERTEELVVLDVRTAEEFAEGHLDGAIMIDFYAEDFADSIADLDRDAPYLLYCRSGNRSGQTRTLMEELGFTDVTDVDGGIVAWADAGFPLVVP